MHDHTNYSENPANITIGDNYIDCIKTRGVSVKQKWLGETIHLQDIITQTFEILFTNPLAQKDLSKWIQKIQGYPSDAVVEDRGFNLVGEWLKELNLYGVEIQNCRIVSIEAPTSSDRMQDGIGRGRIDVTIEQRECGDLDDLDNRERQVINPCYECVEDGATNGVFVTGTGLDPLASAVAQCGNDPEVVYGAVPVDVSNCAPHPPNPVNDYQGLKNLIQDACPYLDDISEDFKFDYGKGNNIDFTHTVNIKLFDSCAKGIDAFHAITDTGGPGQAGDNVGFWVEGTHADTEWDGDDGDPDGVTVCRPGQYNVDDALRLARRMLDENVPHFGIAFNGGVLKHVHDQNVIPYYTETQNLITGEVTMTKRLTILKKRDADLDWSADYTHSLRIDASGIATVTERGKIRGYKKLPNVAGAPPTYPEEVVGDAYQRALDGMGELLGVDFTDARDRCVNFWEAHREFYKNYFDSADASKPDKNAAGEVPVDLHVEHPMEKTRNFNEITRECSYSISFSTSPNIFENFMANRTLTASRGEFGSITIKEKSDLTQYVPKGEDQKKIELDAGGNPTGVILDEADAQAGAAGNIGTVGGKIDNPIEIIFPEDYRGKIVGGVLDPNTGAKARVMSFYNDLLADTKDFTAPNPQGCTDALKFWSRNISWNPAGRNLSYSVEYTTDKTVSCDYPDKYGIRQTEYNVDDKLPKRLLKEHAIAQYEMLVHDPIQTSLGSRTVTLKVILERQPKYNMIKDPKLPDTALRELAERAKAEALKVFDDHEDLVLDDMFVKSCKYTFDSKWDATFTYAVDYLQKK